MNWRTTALWGGGLGVAVVVWQIVSSATGLTHLFAPVATALEVGVLVLALKSTADEHSFLQQLFMAVGVAVGAGGLIMGGAILTTSVLFPEILDQTRVEVTAQMIAAGESPDRIAQVMGTIKPSAQAVAGFLGTVATALVFGPPIAFFAKRR